MKPRLNLKPAQLVLVSLAGFLISVASFSLIRFVRTRDASDCIRWIPVLLFFAVFIVGVGVSLKATTSLKNGVENQQWSEEQIGPLRSWLESSYFNAAIFALMVGYIVLWFAHSRFRDLGLAGYIFMLVLTQLRNAVRRPRTKPSNMMAGWGEFSPIRSDHWGQH